MVCDRCNSVLREDDLGVSMVAATYTMVICQKCLVEDNFTDVCFVEDDKDNESV